jgi:hypothetical protein
VVVNHAHVSGSREEEVMSSMTPPPPAMINKNPRHYIFNQIMCRKIPIKMSKLEASADGKWLASSWLAVRQSTDGAIALSERKEKEHFSTLSLSFFFYFILQVFFLSLSISVPSSSFSAQCHSR